MDKLKPCPFCGGKAIYAGLRGKNYEICCLDCPAFIVDRTIEDAVKAWNKREGQQG